MKRREFLKQTSSAAVAVTAVAATAHASIPDKEIPKSIPGSVKPFGGLPVFVQRDGFKYRWIRTDRIPEFLKMNWTLVNEFDKEVGLDWPHVGGLHLVRKSRALV